VPAIRGQSWTAKGILKYPFRNILKKFKCSILYRKDFSNSLQFQGVQWVKGVDDYFPAEIRTSDILWEKTGSDLIKDSGTILWRILLQHAKLFTISDKLTHKFQCDKPGHWHLVFIKDKWWILWYHSAKHRHHY